MNAMQRLNQIVKERGPLVAGLDPDIRKILSMVEASQSKYDGPDEIMDEVDILESQMWDFCEEYLEALQPEVGVVKINSAFFEACGMEYVYWEIAKYAKELGYFVIGDLKRADIGNMSEQYANAFLCDGSPFDAITINPYFGTDGIKPFLDLAKETGKGVFVLVKTSNPSSAEIQDLVLKDGKTVYMKVAELVNQWGNYTNPEGNEDYNLVGAVVGATHPKQAEELRKIMPNTFFLVPGYGAQGATAKDIVVNFDKQGGGAVVNSSRGIMMAYNSKRWKNQFTIEKWSEAAKCEAIRAQSELIAEVGCYLEE